MTIDWFSPAQCVGYAAFALGVGSFMQKDDRRFKILMEPIRMRLAMPVRDWPVDRHCQPHDDPAHDA